MTNNKEYRLRFDGKARELLAQMTLEEKIYMIGGHSKITSSFVGGNYNIVPYYFGSCRRFGLPELAFCDGPRGVVSGHSTCFPVAMACGATFDRDLEREVGHVIGREIRGNGGSFFGGDCMNVPYNPGAGRSQESISEDSYHMGEMAVALMEGVQAEGVVACAKHFALNSMERSRFKVSVTADKRTEHEVYLPHFKKVVEAGAGSVMSAYNLYQGEKCGHNTYLLRHVLKNKWDFDGFVISDFLMGVTDTVGGITGGCDVEMHVTRQYSEKKVKKALAEGKISERQIDEACLRIIRTTLAFEEQRNALPKLDASVLACKEHTQLARRVASEAVTLLKNKDELLPLSKQARVVFLGDLTKVENIGDHGSSMVRPPYIKTILDAMKEEYGDVRFDFVATGEVNKKAALIRSADAVVITAGMRHGDEGEFAYIMGGDRKSLRLHDNELRMIHQAASLNANTAVILMGGNVIMTHDWQDKVKAILFAYYPGMEGGGAICDVLFGKVNPCGKLPFAIAQDEKDYPQVNWNTKQQHYGYWHGYQKLDKDGKKPDFPFGFGLSYTSFAMSEMGLESNDDEKAVFTASVTNTGDREGAQVVQVYVSFPESPVTRPVRTLMGFEKVFLKPGESKKVLIQVNKKELGWYDEKADCFQYDAAYTACIATDEQSMCSETIRF